MQLVFRNSRYEDDEKAPVCASAGKPVTQPLARTYERMLASRAEWHAAIPRFDIDPRWTKAVALQRAEDAADAAPAETAKLPEDNPFDMATYLAQHLKWYAEYPHVDRTFEWLFGSWPGYNVKDPGQ